MFSSQHLDAQSYKNKTVISQQTCVSISVVHTDQKREREIFENVHMETGGNYRKTLRHGLGKMGQDTTQVISKAIGIKCKDFGQSICCVQFITQRLS